MSIALVQDAAQKYLSVTVSGKLQTADYARLVPQVERLIRSHGKLHILLILYDFHGWTAGAMWEDIKFDARHFSDIAKLAVVGEAKWEKGMAAFCKPFTAAKVRYFSQEEIAAAQAWVEQPA